MRTVVSVVAASLIATSAMALSSVTEVGAVPSPDVVISQVYGGGGNSGATYTNDFIELYNRGTAPVPLDGWTVQYASSAGVAWAPTLLSGTLPAGSYYLVQEAQGGGGTTPLPTPDATGTTAMSGTSGKVALVTSTAALSCGADCDAAAGVRDFVGYGTANDSETAPTPALSNTTAAIRAAGGATDTDNNSADFSVGAPSPRNCGAACVPPPPPIPPVRISELHYDNDGADAGEAVEVTGPAGVNLAGWSLVLYNGDPASRAVYDTIVLTGTLDDEGAGIGAAAFPIAGIQNGAPDGLALVEPLGTVVEFLSYEGSFTAVGGAANGVLSTDIGVIEDDTTPVGFSLQLLNGAWTRPLAASFGVVNFVPRHCPLASEVTLIHQAQGPGAETPCPSEDITIEGVVVADFEGAAPTLRGFYVQEEDADVDADPATSEALFVFNASNNNVNVGDAVRITGVVAEFQDQTQINFPTVLTILSTGNTLPTASTVTLPFAALDSLEAVEGMLVTIPQTLYVTEFFQLGRFGEVLVSSGDRLAQPTANVAPGAPARAMQAANDLNQLIIDDTLNNQNADPIVYGGNGAPLTAANPLRGGDTVTGATGVMTFTWAGNSASPNAYRLRPATGPIAFQTANPRPTSAPDVGGSLKIASFNVLNYFLTLDDGGLDCGRAGNKQECRGAETAAEYQRQHVKLMAALDTLDADILGLIELENSDGVEPLAAIVDGLNAINGTGTYAYINTGVFGTDTIKVGIIYKPSAVSPLRAHAIIDSSVDPRFIDTRNRPSLAQSFVENSTGEVMTIVVNHLKSKNCGGETGGDVDDGDGHACFDATRTAAAEALVAWIKTHPTGVDDDDFLVMGDLNSYAKEDPVTVFTNAGFVDLAAELDDSYSFVFDGQWGYLDYALASKSLAAQISGAAEYHINADEVPVLDYNTNFKSAAQLVSLFAPDEFRTSDHDPVVVGLDLDGNIDAAVVAVPFILWPANHTLRNVTVVAVDRRLQRLPVDILATESSELDSGLGRGDIPGDIVPVDHDTVRLRAERFGRFGRTYTIDVVVESNHQSLVDSARVFVFPSFGGNLVQNGQY